MEITGELLGGGEIDWKSYRGKVVLVDFSATWCGRLPSTRRPTSSNMYKAYHDKGFDVLAVSLDDTPEAAEKYIDGQRASRGPRSSPPRKTSGTGTIRWCKYYGITRHSDGDSRRPGRQGRPHERPRPACCARSSSELLGDRRSARPTATRTPRTAESRRATKPPAADREHALRDAIVGDRGRCGRLGAVVPESARLRDRARNLFERTDSAARCDDFLDFGGAAVSGTARGVA